MACWSTYFFLSLFSHSILLFFQSPRKNSHLNSDLTWLLFLKNAHTHLLSKFVFSIHSIGSLNNLFFFYFYFFCVVFLLRGGFVVRFHLTAGLAEVIIYSSPDDRRKNRGFCFLEYDSHKSASLAKRRLSTGRVKIFGCDIIVDWADPQEEPDNDTMSRVS